MNAAARKGNGSRRGLFEGNFILAFVVVWTSGRETGKVVSVHSTFAGATAKGSQTVLNVGADKVKVGDSIPDWKDIQREWAANLNANSALTGTY